MTNKITILDVAKEAGVSKSTVSLVINNSSAVKLETQYKVRDAINKLGYVPNFAARGLTTKRNHILGIIFLTSDLVHSPDEFTSVPETLLYDVNIGIDKTLRNTDYALLSERFSTNEKSLPDLITSGRVDGVFIIGGLYQPDFIERLKSSGMPAVLIGREHKEIDSVSPDLTKVGFIAGKKLVHTGHKKILFVNGPRSSNNSQKKLDGLQLALKDVRTGVTAKTLYSGYSSLEAYQTISEIWTNGYRPDAIFGGSDGITAGILQFALQKGIRIPEDISLIGYERSVISEHTAIPYTVIDSHKDIMGEIACNALLNRIHKPNSSLVHMQLEPTLISRDSIIDRCVN
ncbi:LacI family DNA-binding transcriptional regulator [Blautia liquoris]|uniref:LacI family DNA-binding transcriptional regulator n=1 Tax=Blautia liquoris TaxID=2779518 RepID=A0A7M2RHC3_9FIRM|nr:LacI family DNA-binding transcriptional regulator [Blautia liquoris]QOV18772.1 LacI family DNA-binding transcriptional regulator [Blautia liquoris]